MARAMKNEYLPDVVSPPGDTLLETIENFGMTQTELAHRTGRPLKTINEIIKGKAAITPETALQLERVLGIPARFWNNRERYYREYLAQQEEKERLLEQIDWMSEVPVSAMIKLGWIEKQATPVEQAQQILNFFGVATPATYLKLCVGDVAYRRSPAMEGHPAAVAAWLRQGELEARDIECQPYDERKFRSRLPQLRTLTRTASPEVFIPKLQRTCAECGVIVVFVPEIPGKRGTSLCGAARWLTTTKALIQLSLRYKSVTKRTDTCGSPFSTRSDTSFSITGVPSLLTIKSVMGQINRRQKQTHSLAICSYHLPTSTNLRRQASLQIQQ